ncbi:MAG: MaoC family dehydratase N-terminal domain-containing protein [Chloroflexi bacterium]|nr:MaoC family dehydratase N-terminal domain-containing protein [Chloroflexota bacterium]
MSKGAQDLILQQPGNELAVLELTVTPELNQQFLYAMEDFHPRYLETSGNEQPIVHPSLLLLMSIPSKSPSFHLPPGWAIIHAGDETEFIQPARVGTKLLISWKVAKVWEKRGKPYSEVDTRIVDENGVDILRRKVIITYTVYRDAQQEEGGH